MIPVCAFDPNPRKLRLVMSGLAVAVFSGAVSMRILDTLLLDIAGDYGQSVGTAGAVVTAYALSYSVCQLVYGPLGDRVGPYPLITLAAGLSAIAAVGCAWAPTLEWLVVLRLIAGGFAAGIGPLALAWISHATSAEERPSAVANLTAASIMGAVAGQAGGGLLGQMFGWRTSFLFVATVFALSAWAIAQLGTQNPGHRTLGRIGADANRTQKAALFLLLRRPAIYTTLAAVAFEGLAMYLSFTYVAVVLQDRLSLGLSAVSLLIALFGLGGITFVIFSRRLVSRLAEDRRAIWGGSLLGIGFITLALSRSTPLSGLALFLLGVGFFLLHNILQVRATNMAPDAPGTAISLFATSFFLGQAVGAMVGGWSFDHLGNSVSCGASAIALAALGIVMARRSPVVALQNH